MAAAETQTTGATATRGIDRDPCSMNSNPIQAATGIGKCIELSNRANPAISRHSGPTYAIWASSSGSIGTGRMVLQRIRPCDDQRRQIVDKSGQPSLDGPLAIDHADGRRADVRQRVRAPGP